jgi:predicted transcriptional regulator
MAKKRIEKKVFEEHIVSQETGEVITSKTVYKTQTEPEYIKLYIDCLFTVKGVRKGLNPIFLAFLPYMSYADINGQGGGQVIFINKAMKDIIAKKLGLGIDSINKALSELTKAGIFKRLTVGTYQVNPNIVGKGEWKDIKNIRATFDFANKEVVAEIVKEEEEAMTEHQETLSEAFKDKEMSNEWL